MLTHNCARSHLRELRRGDQVRRQARAARALGYRVRCYFLTTALHSPLLQFRGQEEYEVRNTLRAAFHPSGSPPSKNATGHLHLSPFSAYDLSHIPSLM